MIHTIPQKKFLIPKKISDKDASEIIFYPNSQSNLNLQILCLVTPIKTHSNRNDNISK